MKGICKMRNIKVSFTKPELELIIEALDYLEDRAFRENDLYIEDYTRVVEKLDNKWSAYYKRYYRNYKIKKMFKRKGI